MIGRSIRARLDPSGLQVVDVVVDRGYHPNMIVARAGVPLRLVFRRDDRDACSERVVFSSPHLDRPLAVTGTTMIELPAQPPGDVRFTCGMGRYRGRIELVAERAASWPDRLRDRVARLETPLHAALVLWIYSLPLIALAAVVAFDAATALAAAGVALIVWVAACLWAFGHSAGPT